MTNHESRLIDKSQTRLSVADKMRAEVMAVRDELSEIHTLLNQLCATQLDTTVRLQQLQADMTKVAELASMVRRHEHDLISTLADATAGRSDIGSEPHRQHLEIWKRFDLLVTRQVTAIVNAELRRAGGLGDRSKKAELISKLVRALFPSGGDQVPDLTDKGNAEWHDNLAALAEGAAEIRSEAARLGMASCWEFRADWFEHWPYSSGNSRPEFVVLPAWVADDRLLGPGKVFMA